MSTNNYANKEQLIDLLQAQQVPILGAGGGFAPIGFYGWSADYVTGAPQGWLRCEGQEVNIADYPELATFYASQHGVSNYWGGDGITTFAVPDLRGEYIRGAGTNSHANQGNGGSVGEHQDGTRIPYVSGYEWSGSYYVQEGLPSEKNIAPTNTDNESDRAYIANNAQSIASEPSEGKSSYTVRPTSTSGVFFVKATVSGNPEGYVYSTDEQVAGTWIDGKPIYQKTFSGTSPSSDGAIQTGLTNVGFAYIAEGVIVGTGGYTANIAYDGVSVDVKNDGSEIYFYYSNNNFKSSQYYITIRYTKTTS